MESRKVHSLPWYNNNNTTRNISLLLLLKLINFSQPFPNITGVISDKYYIHFLPMSSIIIYYQYLNWFFFYTFKTIKVDTLQNKLLVRNMLYLVILVLAYFCQPQKFHSSHNIFLSHVWWAAWNTCFLNVEMWEKTLPSLNFCWTSLSFAALAHRLKSPSTPRAVKRSKHFLQRTGNMIHGVHVNM